MAARQFVSVKFRPTDDRDYCYHNDGAPVRVGDWIDVETRDGIKSVLVFSVRDGKPPPFETKPIIGKSPDA